MYTACGLVAGQCGRSVAYVVMDRQLALLFFELEHFDRADLASRYNMRTPATVHGQRTETHRSQAVLVKQVARYVIVDQLIDGVLQLLGRQRLGLRLALEHHPALTRPVVPLDRLPAQQLTYARDQVACGVQAGVQAANVR